MQSYDGLNDYYKTQPDCHYVKNLWKLDTWNSFNETSRFQAFSLVNLDTCMSLNVMYMALNVYATCNQNF